MLVFSTQVPLRFRRSCSTNRGRELESYVAPGFDLPIRTTAHAPGYDLSGVKEGVDFARPPCAVLKQPLAVRVHLDDCDEQNGLCELLQGLTGWASFLAWRLQIRCFVAAR